MSPLHRRIAVCSHDVGLRGDAISEHSVFKIVYGGILDVYEEFLGTRTSVPVARLAKCKGLTAPSSLGM